MKNEVVLTGLDGGNPLGFMAALGVLNAVSDAGLPGRLSWRECGRLIPVLTGVEHNEAGLLELLLHDQQNMAGQEAFDLEYDGVRDLKPPPDVYRGFLNRVAQETTPSNRVSADFVAAFATDVATDGNGNTKPTALHFTAGQQVWLNMVRILRDNVTSEDLNEALFGPWSYSRMLPVLSWDATASRDYALRASNPSGDKKTGVPGADWLAVRGLPFFGVVPRGKRVATTCCSGDWKTGAFTWPLWDVSLPRDMVATLLRHPGLRDLSNAFRREIGISAMFSSSIRRSDQGGYGTFSPPAVI